MKISILQEKLAKGLSSVGRVVPSRPSLPILANVLLEARGGRLQLTATDLNLGMRLWIGAKITKEGAISVPAKVFGELVSSFPASTIEMSLEGDSLRISCEGHKARLAGIAASEYPSLGKLSGKKEFGIDFGQFHLAVERVAFAASADETRPVLSGVLWEFHDKTLRLVATDGYRLSLVGVRGDSKKTSEKWLKAVKSVVGDGLIVPARALRDVDRLADELGASEVKVGMVSDQNLAVFSLGEGEVVTRLIEGSFPSFSQVIPAGEKSVAEIEVEPLAKAVRTAAIFARDSANIVHWKLAKSLLTISANAPSYGQSESGVEVNLAGPGGEIAFNSRYLIELFNIFPSEKLKFVLNESLDPGLFQPLDGKEEFLHIVMPVRVQK
jgi:DNA polymerase-3 subunit beta